MDQNGIPAFADMNGVFDDEVVQNRMAQIVDRQVSYGALTRGALNEMDGPVQILIDPLNRRVYAEDGTGYSAVMASSIAESQILVPESGQSGRSLTWSEVSRSGGFPATVGDPIKLLVDPTKPAKTVQSLVASIIDRISDAELANPPFVVIDQSNGNVTIAQTTAYATTVTALNALSPSPVDGIIATLSEPPAEAGETAQIFEGGEIA